MTDPPRGDERVRPPSRPPLGEAALIAAVGLAVFAALSWWAFAPARPRPGRVPADGPRANRPTDGFVGDRSCRDCHPGEYAAYTKSGHARTLRPAAEADAACWLDGREVEDPERPGTSWAYALRNGRLVVQGDTDGGPERLLLDYAFGSGRHATTFVSTLDTTPGRVTAREHRLTYFAHDRAMGVTPGQVGSRGRPGSPPAGRELSPWFTYKCFDCHATRTSTRPGEELDLSGLIPNVSCERCHGPGRAHVEAARRGDEDLALPFDSDRGTAEALVRSCGECHRLPEVATAGSIRPDNPLIVRFQPIGLLQSRCYTRSGGRLSCVTCHEPHSRPSTDRLAYEAICLDCHRDAPQATCPVSPRDGCLDCHMPRRDSGEGLSFTDHWIRVRTSGESGPPGSLRLP